MQKLQHPGAKSNPPYKHHIERTHNEINKGKQPNKTRERKKQRLPSGHRDNRKDERRAQRHNTYQPKDRKERLSRAALNETPPIMYPSQQTTPIYPSPYHTNQILAWAHPLMMAQMTPWVTGFPTGSRGVTATKTIEGTPATFTTLQKNYTKKVMNNGSNPRRGRDQTTNDGGSQIYKS